MLFVCTIPQERVPHPCVLCKGGRRCCLHYVTVLTARPNPHGPGIPDSPFAERAKDGAPTVGDGSEIKSFGHRHSSDPHRHQSTCKTFTRFRIARLGRLKANEGTSISIYYASCSLPLS